MINSQQPNPQLVQRLLQ